MTTKESKLTYERNNVTLSGSPYDIQINSSTLNIDDGNTLVGDVSYYVESIVLYSNGTSTQSGAKRRLASYSLTGGVLNLEAQSIQENYIADSSRINISHTTSGADIVIRLESATNSANQNCRVFVNIKAYS